MHSIFRKTYLFFFVLQSMSLALGTNFLNFSENANDLALGRHPSIGGSSVVNPSLIKQDHESPIFFINSGNWYGDISISGLNYVHKVGRYNNRLFLKQAEINDLEFRGSEPSDDPNAMFSAYGFQLGSGFSIKNNLGDFGVSISYLSIGIYDQSSEGFIVDLGYSKLLLNGWNMGLSVLNLGHITKLYQEVPKLPTLFLFGGSKSFKSLKISNKIYTTAEYSIIDDFWKLKLGLDSELKKIKILTGYSIDKHSAAFSFGGGISSGRFGVTYAIKFGSQKIGNPKVLSLSYILP
tara:strand:+ start:886 stop:1764 length:879 start_codon:yes stop_codon:yes gene_type:complete